MADGGFTSELTASVGTVARQLLGEPNTDLSDNNVLRFGSHGSMSVCIGGEKRGTWYDHEACEGGGVIDLVQRCKRVSREDALGWLKQTGSVSSASARPVSAARRIVATYPYTDAAGAVLYEVVRYEPKDFRQRRPKPGGAWDWSMKGQKIVPFRLPAIVAAPPEIFIYVVEGEKDVLALEALGVVATCNPGGAGKWPKAFAEYLANRHVVVLPDNDEAGAKHAQKVVTGLRAVAESIRVLDLPGLPAKGDVSDWLATGGSAERLAELTAAQPEHTPAELESGDPPETDAEAEPSKRKRATRSPRDPSSLKGPLIRVSGGNLHNEATAGEDALLASGRPIYQRGNDLVRPMLQVVAASKGRSTHSAALVEIGAAGLTDALCQDATWERFDRRSDEWIEINPPGSIAPTILARIGQWRFPRIAGIITTPTLRPDGSLLCEPGYDAATRFFHMADPDLQLRPSVQNPTRANAEAALDLLRTLLEEFPFTDDVSRSVALSGVITPVVRGALSVAPLHAFRAYTAGTGKSYMADVASAISTGRPCPVTSAAGDEAETEKRIAGMLLAGFPIACLDNVNGELGGDLLCQAIERPLIRLRPLGRSDIVEIESRSTMFATGNALRVRGDMVRRTLVCSLDAGVERPELREFIGDPIAKILANRGLYVSACLVIVRAYAAAESPGTLKPIASFEDWSDTVRSALVWLGCADPADSMQAARDDDPELTELREMLTLWHEAFGTDAMTAKDVADAIHQKEPTQMGEPTGFQLPDLRDALLRLVGERGDVNTKRFGKWLMNREGRIVAGRRFTKATTQGHGGVTKWQVVKSE